MTPTHQHSSPEDVWGRKIASRLDVVADTLPHDIVERLKAARIHALSKRMVISPLQMADNISVLGGTATLGGGDTRFGLWRFMASWLPLLLLVTGLLAVVTIQDEYRTQELADIDSEILTDELPPAAFTDPGFTQFLRANYDQ